MRTTSSTSISALQKRSLEKQELDFIGSDEKDFAPVTLDAITAVLVEMAEQFIIEAQTNLQNADKIASGTLSDSIVPTAVEINGSVYTIGINIASYYTFVDKGVRGWLTGGGGSPYQFKAPGARGTAPKNSKMVNAIRKWVIRESLSQRTTSITKPISKRESKRLKPKSLTDTSTRTAIVIAATVRRRGLEPTNFWGDTEATMIDRLREAFGLALKVDILNNLQWQ